MSWDLNAFCKNPEASKAKGGLNFNEIVYELIRRGLDSTGSRKLAAARLCKAVKAKVKVKVKAVNPQAKPKTVSPQASPQAKPKIAKPKTASPQAKPKIAKPQAKPKIAKQKTDRYASVLPYENYVSDHTAQFKIISTYDPKRRIINLSGPVLRQFSNFVKAGVEFGGMIDINKDGSFDRAMFGIGMKGSIKINDMLDFEVMFHTHPSGRTMLGFEKPSKPDISVSMFASTIEYADRITAKNQVHVVFSPEAVYTIYVPNTKIDYRHPSIINEVLEAVGGFATNVEAILSNSERLAQFGIYVFRYSKVSRLKDLDQEEPINNWLDSIPLYIDPQEPDIEVRTRGVRSMTPQERQAQQLNDALQRAQEKQLSEREKLRWINDIKYGD